MGRYKPAGEQQPSTGIADYTMMMFKLLTTFLVFGFTSGAPQYGGVQPSSPVKTAPLTGSVQCRTEYATLWDTEYKETETQVCTTEYEKVCRTETQRLCQPTTRQECSTVYEKQCQTVYKSVCVEQYKTEYEPYTETECSTQYKDDCEYQWEGYGNDKVWAPIAGTCKKNPYETCKDVAKTKEKQVAYPVCNDVPRQNCKALHKKVPVRVSRRVPKKVCQDVYSGVSQSQTERPAAETFIPNVTGSGPEIIDARLKTEDTEEAQKKKIADILNTIVFGN